ncbi:PmoA family protein [Streptomyces sp. NPDC059071]|uniref:DUF6807 domain-containing protein n=1 Tax=unclassified Streptomyces TaxID=2593676 RepID=UPI00364A3A25
MTSSGAVAVLRCGGRSVARYLTRPALAPGHAPRPYLHPVTTPAGRTVTEALPADHPHHLGAGVAVPDVAVVADASVTDVAGHDPAGQDPAAYDFWGGPSFVRGRGYVELGRHGVQRHDGFKLCDPDGFVAELSWTAAGERWLREYRTVAATCLTGSAWALDLTFSLTNVSGRGLSLGSPATNGRPGAAYGGFFWRAPKEASAPVAFGPAGDGEEALHGARADWVALAGAGWTLVFAGATEETRRDPWFVRAAEYPAVGSSLAHDARLALAAGESVVRRVVTVVADGRLGREEAAALVRRAVTA